MNNLHKWKILSSQMLIDHPLCQVRQEEIELLNGKVIDDYFVRQYRHAIGDFFIELPTGSFNADEEGAAALRELIKKLVILLTMSEK